MAQDEYDLETHDRELAKKFGARARRLRKQRETWLNEIAERLATKHKISAIDAHRALLSDLLGTRVEILSGTNLDPKDWKVPRDLTPWKDARAQLMYLAKQLGAATEILKRHDQVVSDALQYAAMNLPHRGLPDLVAAIFEFEQVAVVAASIEGKSGNRPHPPWMRDATELCRQFWRQHMAGEPAGYFNAEKKPKPGQRARNRTTEPANAFSRWFCDVMYDIAGLTPSQCDTLLRH